MKYIQIIDGAQNCGYWIYGITDDLFEEIFPEKGQDIEFIDDFIDRVGEKKRELSWIRYGQTGVKKRKSKVSMGYFFLS